MRGRPLRLSATRLNEPRKGLVSRLGWHDVRKKMNLTRGAAPPPPAAFDSFGAHFSRSQSLASRQSREKVLHCIEMHPCSWSNHPPHHCGGSGRELVPEHFAEAKSRGWRPASDQASG